MAQPQPGDIALLPCGLFQLSGCEHPPGGRTIWQRVTSPASRACHPAPRESFLEQPRTNLCRPCFDFLLASPPPETCLQPPTSNQLTSASRASSPGALSAHLQCDSSGRHRICRGICCLMAPELSCFCMTSNPASSGSKKKTKTREKAGSEGLDGDLPRQLLCLETRLQQHRPRLLEKRELRLCEDPEFLESSPGARPLFSACSRTESRSELIFSC